MFVPHCCRKRQVLGVEVKGSAEFSYAGVGVRKVTAVGLSLALRHSGSRRYAERVSTGNWFTQTPFPGRRSSTSAHLPPAVPPSKHTRCSRQFDLPATFPRTPQAIPSGSTRKSQTFSAAPHQPVSGSLLCMEHSALPRYGQDGRGHASLAS